MSVEPSSVGDLHTRLQAFPEQVCVLDGSMQIGYRCALPKPKGPNSSQPIPIVLLHGIGSGSASWVQQLETLGATHPTYAWDAPGYGQSTPLDRDSPSSTIWGSWLSAFLAKQEISSCILVGHSLGAIMAVAAAAGSPFEFPTVVLLSPAIGYKSASKQVRDQKRDDRLAMLNELGPQGMALKRSSNMVSPRASAQAIEWVQWNMSRINPIGYTHATHTLSNANLLKGITTCLHVSDTRFFVAVGENDTITTPEQCERVAQIAKCPLKVIPNCGHAGYIEQPQAFTDFILECCTLDEN